MKIPIFKEFINVGLTRESIRELWVSSGEHLVSIVKLLRSIGLLFVFEGIV